MIRRLILLSPALLAFAADPSPWTMARLPGTGQTARYGSTFGQDADYPLSPPSFFVNGDGTVTDMVTGLIWQQSEGPEMQYESAAPYCKSVTLGGFKDWRLPFAHEGYSILNHGSVNPALDTRAFTKGSAEYWWTSEARADDATRIWVTNAGGGIGAHPKTETVSAGGARKIQVRCVRSSIAVTSLRANFTDNGDGTVTDNHTGLMWQKADSGTAMPWDDALRYSEGLSLAGFDDWRVPNIKELQSINEERLVNPSLDRTYFSGMLPAETWSSTTQINSPTKAWTVDFALGIASYREKAESLRVRSVRGGPVALTAVSSASFAGEAPLASASLASAFGKLAGLTAADAALTLTDSRGVTLPVPLLAVSANQANFVVPETASPGVATITLTSNGRQIAAGVVRLERVAPSLFSANADGKGVAAAVALTVSGGRQTSQLVFDDKAAPGSRRGIPIDVSAGNQVYLLLFGTGMRNAAKAVATVGGVDVPVSGPAAQGEFAGLDQVNLGPLPASLAGRGDVSIAVTVDGKAANPVTVSIK
jgi:uncharacterized protein (TIGR03437 family)